MVIQKSVYNTRQYQAYSVIYISQYASTLGCKVSYLVIWCFKPSQPQRIISGLKINFSLSPSYSFHKS